MAQLRNAFDEAIGDIRGSEEQGAPIRDWICAWFTVGDMI
jgi:hypothetical protein